MNQNDPLHILRSALAALAGWLRRSNLESTLIGGVAASLRGKPRLTNDVDILVIDADIDDLLATSSKFGFSRRIPDAADFAHASRVLLLRFDDGNVDLDVSLGGLPFEIEAVRRSDVVRFGGLELRVAQPEDLIIMKAVAGRPRDVSDIESLIEANPTLDVDRIRRWTRELASMLDRPEIHEDLERLLSRRRR